MTHLMAFYRFQIEHHFNKILIVDSDVLNDATSSHQGVFTHEFIWFLLHDVAAEKRRRHMINSVNRSILAVADLLPLKL